MSIKQPYTPLNQNQPVIIDPLSMAGSSSSVNTSHAALNRLARIAAEKRTDRKHIAVEMMKALLSNPNRIVIDEAEVAKIAVACTDELLSTLEVTQTVKDRLNG